MSKLLESVNKCDFDTRISEVVEMLEEKQLYGTINLIKDLKYYLDLATEEKTHTCNCQHNHNSNSDEPCCRCDSRVSENDNTINKVTSLEIIVRTIGNEPYYEIKYKKVGEDYYHVGYSSYNLCNVLKWYSECFELINVKMTNADKIRDMTDEEMAEMLAQWDNVEKNPSDWLEWLQSPTEV